MHTPVARTRLRNAFVGLLGGGAAGFLLLDGAAALLALAFGGPAAGDGEPVVLIIAVPAVCAVLGCLAALLLTPKGGR